jgi:uncharacterized alkaline shock family protein YloU
MDDMDNREFMEEVESGEVAGASGKVRISEDVVAQIAVKALSGVEGVRPASPGLMANLRLGRKATNGVRILLSEGEFPEVQVDAYVAVRYGLRIPDVCWDVQEAIKEQVERYTGYTVRAVNVFVQGITFQEKRDDEGYEEAPSFIEED